MNLIIIDIITFKTFFKRNKKLYRVTDIPLGLSIKFTINYAISFSTDITSSAKLTSSSRTLTSGTRRQQVELMNETFFMFNSGNSFVSSQTCSIDLPFSDNISIIIFHY